MTLATYVNYVLPFVVLALGAGALLLNTVIRGAMKKRSEQHTKAVVDDRGLMSHRRV